MSVYDCQIELLTAVLDMIEADIFLEFGGGPYFLIANPKYRPVLDSCYFGQEGYTVVNRLLNFESGIVAVITDSTCLNLDLVGV